MYKLLLALLVSIQIIPSLQADELKAATSISAAPTPIIGNAPATLKQIIEGSHRSPENKHRDQYRHPEETLNFFDVKDIMTVVEIWPGDGWYTEILAPFLREKGKFYAAQFSPDTQNSYQKAKLAKFNEKLKSQPSLYDKVEITTLQPPEYLKIAPDGHSRPSANLPQRA